MKIEVINNLYTNENCYLLINGNEAVVIDPGSEGEKILTYARKNGAQIKYILLTHCHYDHICGVESLRNLTGAKLEIFDICAENAEDMVINLSSWVFDDPMQLKGADIIIPAETSELDLCGMNIKILKTPGHTSCGVSYLIGNHVFTGDTLFLRSVGRWDFPTADREKLKNSIINVLYSLEGDIEVNPGHGGNSSIEYEKKYNTVIPLLEVE